MSIFTGELGLQFVTHLANHYTVPDLVRLAQFAADKGFKHIWVNDNIRSWCLTFTIRWTLQTALAHLPSYAKDVRSALASPAAISANRPSMCNC